MRFSSTSFLGGESLLRNRHIIIQLLLIILLSSCVVVLAVLAIKSRYLERVSEIARLRDWNKEFLCQTLARHLMFGTAVTLWSRIQKSQH